MEDLKNGLDEQGLIGFVKTFLLSGNEPRGKEAHKNLEWGIKQYRKQLILHIFSQQRELLIAFLEMNNWFSLEDRKNAEGVVDCYLKAINCG